MSDDQAREFQERGIQAARAGQKDEARKFLQQAIRLNPKNDTTWLYLAGVARNNKERLLCLKQVLQLNPKNELGLKAVRAMGIDPEILIPKASTIAESMVTENEEIEVSGVPIPGLDALENAQELAEEIAALYLDPPDAGTVVWEKKVKRRAGERELLLMKLQVATTFIAFVVIVGGGLIYAFMNSPALQLTLFGASSTPRPPTNTPTNTATNTPGFTPTPSPTIDFTSVPTYTPSPEMPLQVTPWPAGVSNRTPVPTEPHLPYRPVSAAVSTAVALISEDAEGNAEEVLPKMEQAIEELGGQFSPNPFYYKSLAYNALNRFQNSEEILDDAQNRLDNNIGVAEQNVVSYQTLIDLGYAQMNLKQAENALNVQQDGTAATYLQEVRTRTRSSRLHDPEMADAYVVEAKSYLLERRYEEAIAVLDEAVLIPGLVQNQSLAIIRGQIYLAWAYEAKERGELDRAWELFNAVSHAAFTAAYINPFNQEVQLLRVTSAIEMGDIGLAAIRCEDYLAYFPNSAEAHRLYGDVRVMQGNTDLALYTYTQALKSEGTDMVKSEVYISRAMLYSIHRRHAQALADLSAAIELNESLSTRVMRLHAAYAAGDFDTAREDADHLLGTGAISDMEILLYQARMLVDDAEASRTGGNRNYTQALELLGQVGGLPANLQPVADEYRARAYYALRDYANAMTAIDRALNSVETGSRHYLRGLIFEASGDEINAAAEYAWVLTWDAVYRYPFSEDARARIQGFIDAKNAAIANMTATAIAEETEQAQAAATATAEAERTAEATGEATAEDTPEPENEGEPTLTQESG